MGSNRSTRLLVTGDNQALGGSDVGFLGWKKDLFEWWVQFHELVWRTFCSCVPANLCKPTLLRCFIEVCLREKTAVCLKRLPQHRRWDFSSITGSFQIMHLRICAGGAHRTDLSWRRCCRRGFCSSSPGWSSSSGGLWTGAGTRRWRSGCPGWPRPSRPGSACTPPAGAASGRAASGTPCWRWGWARCWAASDPGFHWSPPCVKVNFC